MLIVEDRRPVMMVIRNNKNSFKRHVEDMKYFRQNHKSRPAEQFEDMPQLLGVKLPQETGLIESISDDYGRVVFFPIWKIKLLQGTNN